MSTTKLAVKSGRNAMRDTYKLGELSNAGQPWSNSTGTFRGEQVTRHNRITFGQMPADERAELSAHIARGACDYAIFSYETPIAYRVRSDDSAPFWVVTDTRYSNTTSQQVGKLWVLTQERCGYTGPSPV